MSSDTGVPNSAPADIDLDKIEVEILILAKNVNPLQQAANVLTRRGWPTTVIGNLQKAVEHIAEKRPDFVLISVNHPHPTITKLPDIISQAFNLTCVAFSETADTAGMNKLTSFKSRYKITGVASGPNVHRTLRKVLAEKLNINIDDKGSTTGDSKSTASDVVDDNTVFGEDSKEPQSQMIRMSGGKAANQKTVVQKSGPGATADAGVMVTSGGERSAMLRSQQSASDETEGDGSIAGDVVSSGKYTMQTSRTRKSLKALSGGLAASPSAGVTQEQTKETADLLGKVKDSLFGDAPRSANLERAQVTLKEATQKGFERVCKIDGDKSGGTQGEGASLDKSTRIGVFPIESGSAPGYLTVALEIDQGGSTETFLKSCEGVLRESLQQQGFDGKVEEGFWLNIPEVDFEQWAKEMSLLYFKFNHSDSQVVVAFFQTDQPLPKLRGTSQPDMVAVNLESIVPEKPVNFRAYLYLEKNRKFFLYLRNGKSLAEKQKNHLIQSNVKDICIKKTDAQNLRMFMAANYLNDMIKSLIA